MALAVVEVALGKLVVELVLGTFVAVLASAESVLAPELAEQ